MLFTKQQQQQQQKQSLESLFTPDNCVDSSRIRAFLRLSRIASDDTIKQHLNEVERSKCNDFFETKIAPEWRSRAHAIQYCSDYASSLRHEIQTVSNTNTDYDYRTDPYAGRAVADQVEEHNRKCVTIENWVANEMQVESIIREQTASVLNDKCYYSDWLKAFKKLT